jgi:F420H(2)-dependent quinone reductase
VPEVDEFNRRNIEEFRGNHGRLGGPFEGAPVLLLHTTGARSGQERVHPLMYLATTVATSCSPRPPVLTAAQRGTGTSLPTLTPVSKWETITSTCMPLS